MGSSFYPHGKPGYYSYTERFLEVGNDTKAQARANTKYPGLGGKRNGIVTNKALTNLQILINAARAAELAFLNDTGINLEDPNASNIFRNINKIFNSKETFERGMNYMKSMAQSGKKGMRDDEMYRDVSRYFSFYLRKTLKAQLKNFLAADILHMDPNQIKNLINELIGRALIETYTNVKDFISDNGKIRGKFGKYHRSRKNEQQQQAINDMIKVIKDLQATGAFKEYGYLFNLSQENLAEMTNRKNTNSPIRLKKEKFNDAKIDATFGGNILELITTTVAAYMGNININNKDLHITGMHTGQMNSMKADTMLFVGSANVNPKDYLDLINGDFESVRMQNIDAMSRYLDKLENSLKHVIMISDKNYSITAHFDGISAQDKMRLDAAMGMLSYFGVANAPELLNYLANCGPSMVQGDVNGEVRTELQTLIGYFLFDHLQIDVKGSPKGPNVVNLLNISGIYMPLSVYLEGLYNSFKEAISRPTSFVKVTISLGGQTEQPVWTAGTWGEFRQSHETQSFISYRILSGITQFFSRL